MRNSKRLLALVLALCLALPAPAWATITNGGGAGIANSTSAGTTLVVTPDDSFAVGNYAILMIGFDNTGTTDADHNEIASITGTQTNTWTKLCEFTNGQTAADAGVTVSTYMSRITSPITSGVDTITVTFANTIARKVLLVRKFTVNGGSFLIKVGTCQTEAPDGTADPGSLAVTGLTSEEHLCFRATAQENDETTNQTVTSNYTIINDAQADGGADADSIRLDGELRIHTADNCTSDPTTTHTDTDGVSVLVALKELPGGGSSRLMGVGR